MDATELKEELERQAEWRREKVAEYPDDGRNADAATLLDRLAKSVERIDPVVVDTFYSLFDDGSDSELWLEWLRQVGFHQWPESAEELCRAFIADRAGTK